MWTEKDAKESVGGPLSPGCHGGITVGPKLNSARRRLLQLAFISFSVLLVLLGQNYTLQNAPKFPT